MKGEGKAAFTTVRENDVALSSQDAGWGGLVYGLRWPSMDMGKDKTQHQQQTLTPVPSAPRIHHPWEPGARQGSCWALCTPPPTITPSFFSFFRFFRYTHGVLAASPQISSAHRSRVRGRGLQVEQRNPGGTDAPGRARMGLSCHKPAHGVWVGLLRDGD